MEELIKYIGALLILLSGTMLGWFISWSYIRRIRDLREMKLAINIIDNEMLLKQSILAEALEITAKRVKSPVKDIFLETSQKIKEYTSREFYELWLEIIEKYKYSYFFTKRDIEIINQWANQIGRISLKKQEKINSALIKDINDHIIEAKGEANKKVKLYRYSGALISLIIIIIFY